jgi:hypothetical protein
MVHDQWIDYDQAEIVRQADRYNQLAATEGISCTRADQLVIDGGVDTAGADESADRDNAVVTSQQGDSDGDCIHGQVCPLP